MQKDQIIGELKRTYNFFSKTIEVLTEEDSTFAPVDGVYTTAQQIAHTAQTVDWFITGAFVDDKFDLDFEEHHNQVKKVESITEAKEWLKRSFDNAIEVIESKSDEEILSPLPEGPIMGGAPRFTVIGSISDHTAHHRGALTVYARLVGKTPKMPYGE